MMMRQFTAMIGVQRCITVSDMHNGYVFSSNCHQQHMLSYLPLAKSISAGTLGFMSDQYYHLVLRFMPRRLTRN